MAQVQQGLLGVIVSVVQWTPLGTASLIAAGLGKPIEVKRRSVCLSALYQLSVLPLSHSVCVCVCAGKPMEVKLAPFVNLVACSLSALSCHVCLLAALLKYLLHTHTSPKLILCQRELQPA